MTEGDAKKVAGETAALKKLLAEAELAHGGIGGWTEERWWPEVRSAHGRIEPNRLLFFFVRIGQVSGAAAIPVFATAGTLTSGHTWGWVTVVVSLLLALLVGFDQVYRPGIRWRAGYDEFHALVNAAWTYLESTKEPTASNEPTFPSFVKTVEGIIAAQRVDYLRDIASLNTTVGGLEGTVTPTR
jgi:hypothetical protein